MDFDERVISGEMLSDDAVQEYSIRPRVLEEYIGQNKVKENSMRWLISGI